MKKQVIVTTSWDDGHKDDLLIAKLLKKYGLKGTFYVCPNDREFKKSQLLSDKEIIELSKDFEIGAHTMTHPKLAKLSINENNAEVKNSKIYLEKLLRKKIYSFSYPYGNYNKITKRIVKKSGFKLSRTVKEMVVSVSTDKLEMGTSVQFSSKSLLGIYGQFKMAVLNGNFKLLRYLSFNWQTNAKRIFDYVYENGGIYHLWGHSNTINGSKQLKSLEFLFKYVSKRTGVAYLNNGESINYAK